MNRKFTSSAMVILALVTLACSPCGLCGLFDGEGILAPTTAPQLTEPPPTEAPAVETLAPLPTEAPVTEMGPQPGWRMYTNGDYVHEIALGDDGGVPADVTTKMEALRDELPGLRAAAAEREEFLGGVRDALALGDGDGLAAARGKVLALAEAAKDAAALSDRVQKLEADAAAKAHSELVERGVAEGKLTQAMIDGWAKDADAATLTAFLAAAPKIVEAGRSADTQNLPPDDSVALTDADRRAAELMGNDPEQVAATKKALRKAG